MKNSSSKVMWAQRACIAGPSTAQYCALLLLLLVTFGLGNPTRLQAQSYTMTDWEDYPHGLDATTGLLQSGDTVSFTVWLGTPAAPATNVAGCQLKLSLSSAAQLPENMEIQLDNSWCFDPANVTADITGTFSLDMRVVATDGSSQSGHGTLFSFALIAAENNVYATDLIADAEGIVIVENIDAKMGQASAITTDHLATANCFPNPTQGRLTLPFPVDGTMQIILIAVDGQTWTLAPSSSLDNVVDLHALPPGMYQMSVLCNGQRLLQERIVKR